jgi:hypothetical protein
MSGGCVTASSSGSTEPSASGAIAPPASTLSASSSPLDDTVRLARAGSHAIILVNGKAFLDTGAEVVIPVQDSPSAPTTEAMTSSSGANVVYVTSRDLHSVDVFTSSDGGTSWATSGDHEITGIEAIGDLHVAALGDQFAVLAVEASSTAVSYGIVATRADTGGSWVLRPAPVGGDIASAGGRFWITGGVMGDQVFASTDGSDWGSIKLTVSATFWTAATATDVKDVGVVIPVTSHDPTGPSDVMFLATSDVGKTWHSLTSVDAPPTEFNTTVPTSITPDGHWVVIWPDGSKIVSGAFARQDSKILSPNGLPTNVYAVAFSSPTSGVAASSLASCPDGKPSCTSATIVSQTDDGGQTWAPWPQ